MKKIHLATVIAAVLILLVSCSSNEGGLSAKAKKNIEVSHAISKCFETNDFSKVGDYIAADAVDHAGERGDIVGLDSIKAVMIQMSQAMTDSKSEYIKDFADDDYVFMWMKNSGTMKDGMMGMPAGMKYSAYSVEASRFVDGKVVEHWTFMTPEDLMKMMPQTMPVDKPADSTAKSDTATKK